MKKRCVDLRHYSILFMLASLLWIVPSVNSQEVPPHTAPPTPPDITRQEILSFDSFLDSHPEIADQLRRNPALVDDREYVNNHPELQAYLQEHPRVREELTENPRIFMRDEDRLDRRDRDDDATRRELATFDTFLDSHPEIAEQLRKNPTLADNRDFLQSHPALKQFLGEHPRIQAQLEQDPRVFMREEDRFDRRGENPRGGQLAVFDAFLDGHPDMAEQLRRDPSLADNKEYLQNHPDLQTFLSDHPEIRRQLAQDPRAFMRKDDRLNREELANLDNFMDNHPEIAEQLRKNPTLGDNKEFLQNHPALQQFLQQHPAIRDQFSQDPRTFMRDEEQFARNNNGNNQGWGRGNVASFNSFLGEHPEISQQLSKDPSLAKNGEYLENHPELREYLNAHADVQQQLAANPQDFMNSTKQFDGSDTTKKQMTEPKPKQ
jgi:phage-related protein